MHQQSHIRANAAKNGVKVVNAELDEKGMQKDLHAELCGCSLEQTR